jgi:hypothetical protein
VFGHRSGVCAMSSNYYPSLLCGAGLYVRTARLLGAAFLACFSASCSPRSLDMKDFSVFTDFTFVGSAPYKAGPGGAPEAQELPKHSTAAVPLPEHPQPGVLYIFHRPGPVDNEKLALADFPARLKSAGITILKAPRSSRDLMYLYIGGPVFRIQIRKGDHEGVIYNDLDPDLVQASHREWAMEDYVLLWFK